MAILSLTKDSFDKVIQGNECVVVDFWASWCGPCLAFAPIFQEVSEKNPDVIFAKIDIEKEIELSEDFQIRSIPYLMIFRREFAVFAEAGVQTNSSLTQLVHDAKQIDIEMLRQQINPPSEKD